MKTFICVLLLTMATVGQRSFDRFPFDEAINVQCDDYLARIDGFFVALSGNPTARGYLVISGKNERLRRKLAYELWFYGAVAFRKFDASSVQVIRGEETGDPMVTFWIVPSGSDYVPAKSVTWNFKLPPGAKPFVFHDDMEQICGSPKFGRVLKEYLDANPAARSNVVVFARNPQMYRRGQGEAKANLHEIPSNRIRFFYRYVPTAHPWAEYWIVPHARK